MLRFSYFGGNIVHIVSLTYTVVVCQYILLFVSKDYKLYFTKFYRGGVKIIKKKDIRHICLFDLYVLNKFIHTIRFFAFLTYLKFKMQYEV